MRFTIELAGMRFWASHGVMAQERTVGQEFVVHVTYQLEVAGPERDDLEGTVSYADIYADVAEEMAQPSDLLETVAWRICSRLYRRPLIAGCSVKVTKTSPPIPGFSGSASVSCQLPEP